MEKLAHLVADEYTRQGLKSSGGVVISTILADLEAFAQTPLGKALLAIIMAKLGGTTPAPTPAS